MFLDMSAWRGNTTRAEANEEGNEEEKEEEEEDSCPSLGK